MISKCPLFLSCIHFVIRLKGDWERGHHPHPRNLPVPCTMKYLSPNGDSRLYYYMNNICNLSYNLPKTYLQVNLSVQHCPF